MSFVLREAAKLKRLLEIFPRDQNISYCFAYGSAIFEQTLDPTNRNPTSKSESFTSSQSSSQSSSSPLAGASKSRMIDLVLAVDDPLAWHRANISLNKLHYSGLRFLGPSWIAEIQQHFGAKIFYNTLIPIDGDYIKYGVIGTRDLVNDLLDWETLYISGRLHKPTLPLRIDETNIKLTNALKINAQSALHAGLLLAPERFTEQQLYMTIAGLSYCGDFRMTFGEDRQKVEKIVAPQIDNFRRIYQPLLRSDSLRNLVVWCDRTAMFEQNCSPAAVQWHLNLLPKTVQHYLCEQWLAANTASARTRNRVSSRFDLDDLMRRVAFDITYRAYLRRAIETIVSRSSWTQSVKGIFTAGLAKSITYGAEKVNKMIKSSKKL